MVQDMFGKRSRRVLSKVQLIIVSALLFLPLARAQESEPGLEVNAKAGAWNEKAGRRGGGLIIDAPVNIQESQPLFQVPRGSCTFLMKTDVPAVDAPGGVVFAAGPLELVKTQGPTWLELRRGTQAVRKMVYDLKPDKWTYVAITWDEDGVALYLNGKPHSHAGTVDRVTARDGVYLGNGLGKTVFDEIQTFETVLPPDAIAARSRRSLSGKVSVSKPTITVPKAAAAPTVDGKLADGEWARAAGFSNFAKHYSSRFPTANRATQAWMAWDDENFYMAFKIPVTQPHPKTKKARDRIGFGDKTVELFFQPNPSGELEYYQLAFDAAGTQYDSRITDREYDAPWTVNCAIDDEWWTAEVAIPYETINAFKPEPGHRWKMNVVCTSGQWSPSGSFHEATKYGLVKFVASEKPGVRIGVINRDNGTLQVPWQLAGGGALTVRATAYPPKGIVPLASERAEASPEQSAGQLMLDLGDQTSGLLEVTAFEEPGEILYRRFISFNKSYLGAVPFLKDQPEEVRKPKKPVVKKDATAAERKAAEAADWRPTIDEIEDAIVEQQKWLGNDIGKAPAVPEPWTPMEIRKDVITCWAKEFDLRRTAGLPRQVRCLDEPIFASAPTLEIDGKSLGGRRPTLLVKRKAGDRIETVGAVELEDFNLTIEARYEFDGFTRYDVTLTPMKAGVTVDGLRLVFPFAKERALYYHVWGGNAYGRPTRETANFVGDEPLVTGFESNVWLGDNERGFCWFAEAPKGWSHPDDKDLIHIVPSRRTVDVTVDMLREGTPLNEPVTITFGTMATPAKPRPDEWRTWEGRPTQDWGWYTVFSFPYPPKNPERFSAANKNPWRLPMLSNFFAGRVYMENGHPVPEQWLWGHLWHTSWSAPRPPAGKAAGTAGNIVSYTAQNMASSWPDFYLYKLKSMREKYNLRSVYLDTCIRQVNNPFSGYTWTAPDGSTRGSVDIFAFRDFQKRIYNFIHQDPEGKVMMHHSNQVAIPILSFADMHMNGEHFNTGPHQVQGRHYSDDEVMPPGAARACFTLKQWGVVPTFLPEHPVSTRSAMGYLWVHDMLIYPAWLPNYDTLHKGRDVRKSFGLGDVTFLGYWGDTPPTKPTPGDIYVSAWKKNDGSAVMLLVANMTYDDTLIPLELNEKNLGIPRGKNEIDTLDLEFGGTFKIRKGTLTVPVKEHDFRLLRIETAE